MSYYIPDNFSNKLLVATPFKFFSSMFAKSLIYILSHTSKGSIGLIVNRPIAPMSIRKTFQGSVLGIDKADYAKIPVHIGGPIDLHKGFFLHSNDYNKNILYKLPNNLSLTSDPIIVKDIIQDMGPKNSLFVVGYTEWGESQIEEEIKDNSWLLADPDTNLIFSEEEPDARWHSALKQIGINYSSFVMTQATS